LPAWSSAGGSLVGPGAAPSGGPTLTASSGGAVDVGAHSYAFTWVTAAGETKPSPAAAITAATLPTPTLILGLQYNTSPVDPNVTGAWKPGDTIEWSYSWSVAENTSPAYHTPLAPVPR
jgi:hypothetical protein